MSRNAKILLVISTLFTAASGLSNVFINIFLWKVSNDFLVVAQYNLMHYIFTPAAFILAGWLSKRKNGIWPIRIGVIIFVLFFSLILMLQQTMVNYVLPLGILFAAAQGFYWLAFHVLSFDFTSPDDRDTFNGYNGSITSLVGAAAPFLGSYIIDRLKNNGYAAVFGCSLALFAVLILVTLLLKENHDKSSLRFNKVFGSSFYEWSLIKKSTWAWGMRDVVIAFLLNILIYDTTGSELSLGKFILFTSLILSASYVVEQKIIKPEKRYLSIHIGAVFMLISVLGLVVKVSLNSLIFYNVTNAVFMPYFIVPFSSASFNIIDMHNEQDFRTEYVINKEISLNSGRVFSTLLLILLIKIVKHDGVLKFFLLFLGCAQLISLYFLRKLHIWED